MVGMFPEMGYEEATVELYPGDVLLVFTDGVPEAHNPEDKEFGEERLQQLLRRTAHLPANEISARADSTNGSRSKICEPMCECRPRSRMPGAASAARTADSAAGPSMPNPNFESTPPV